MSFRFANVEGRSALVDDDDRWYDLSSLTGGVVDSDPMAAIAAGEASLHDANALLEGVGPSGDLDSVRLGAPVPRPRNCFGIGLNYKGHAEESNMELPSTPMVFTKFPSCIVGPQDDIVLDSATADYEVELVVVMGSPARNVTAERAWDHVLGLTAGQDISDRVLQFASQPPHFDLGKSRDTYGPMGPVMVSPDLLPDRCDVQLSCEVNGETRQDDTTANLIFGVADLVAYLSSILTLGPGDVIFTGTPAGIGASRLEFLAPGDEIVSRVEGIGTMRNRCVG